MDEILKPDVRRRLESVAKTLETCGKHGIPIDFAMLASDIREALRTQNTSPTIRGTAMTVSLKLKPCGECGAPCRVETFGGGVHVAPTDLWLCSKHSFFGGDCPSETSYYSARKWNAAQAAMTVSPSPEQLSELQHELHVLIWEAGKSATPLKGYPVADAEKNAFQYGKDCATADIETAVRKYITHTADALESAQAEIARLTTVSGDMVEEMARAIRAAIDASDHLAAGPRDVGEEYHGEQRTLLYVDGAFDLNAAAQAAATIAKGRMERLANHLRQIVLLAENARQFTDREVWQEMEREARAALKDSPNVG